MIPTQLPELADVKPPGTLEHAKNVVQVFMHGSTHNDPVYVVFQDKGDKKWRFHEMVSGHVTATSGQHFYSLWNAKRAAYAHARRIPGATVRIDK